MNRIVIRRIGDVVVEPPNLPSQLRFVRHDWQVPPYLPRSLNNSDYGLPDNKGYPEMIPMYEERWTTLDKAWQEYWYALLGSPSLSAWQSITHGGRFLTNGQGTDKFADYISKRNLDKDDAEMESLTCGGNVVMVIEGDSDSRLRRRNKRGDGYVVWQKIRTLDGTKKPPNIADVNYRTMPWLIQIATNSTPFATADGKWRVDPFPQLDGRDVYFPMASPGGFNWVRDDRLVPLTGNTIPRPYYP